jgi:hypothetical protein
MFPDSSHPEVIAAVALASTRFEIRHRTRRVWCAISDEALEAASNLPLPSTATSRQRSFNRFRTLIDVAARLKLSHMPDSFTGPLTILSDDLRHVPGLEGLPQFSSMSRAIPKAS